MNRSLLLLPLLLAGCASVPPFPEPSSEWKTFSGQLQYANSERSLIGEFAGSRKGDEFRLDVSKGGSVPLLRISRHGQYWRAEGALARGKWQGDLAHVPKPLRGWVVEVPGAFGVTGSNQKPMSNSATRVEVEGGQPGEKFTLVLNR